MNKKRENIKQNDNNYFPVGKGKKKNCPGKVEQNKRQREGNKDNNTNMQNAEESWSEYGLRVSRRVANR